MKVSLERDGAVVRELVREIVEVDGVRKVVEVEVKS